MELMARQTWTDDRMDTLVEHLDERFTLVDKQFEQLHQDNRELRQQMLDISAEIRQENKALAREFRQGLNEHRSETSRDMTAFTRRFDILQATLITVAFALIGTLIASHFG
jgi:hypothetical protein